MSALQSAGFRITARYSNRTIIDAAAPSATVERFFSTQMHTVSQGKYGERFANLTPAGVPSSIAPYIRTASLSNVVIALPKIGQTSITPDAHRTPRPTATPSATPSPKPTATPTPVPTATPTAGPTATPTVAPTATPTPPPAGCNNASPDNGPLSNSSGTLATGVAKPFDFPVEHGCNGAGYTAAVVIDDPINTQLCRHLLSGSRCDADGYDLERRRGWRRQR